MRNHLNVTYPNRWIGRGGPVQWSPDLTPLDFFLWADMKSMVYGTPVTSEEELFFYYLFTTRVSPYGYIAGYLFKHFWVILKHLRL